MENPTTIAVDLSKNVFEIAVEREGRISERKRLNRRQMIEFFSQCEGATVLMETCGSSHYWGRVLQAMGHTVKLLPAQHVKPYRIGQKTDRRDAEAILSARHRESIVPVPVKTVEQQTICALRRTTGAACSRQWATPSSCFRRSTSSPTASARRPTGETPRPF
jgi:transposase